MVTLGTTFTTLVVLSLATISTAQTGSSIIPSTEPPCVNSCDAFTRAVAACAPDSNVQAQYTSCFCQSAYLAPLLSPNPNNLCAPQCSDSDFGTITTWFKGYCANPNAVAPPATTDIPATTLITITTTPPPAVTPTSSANDGGATNVNQASGASNDDPDEWTNAAGWFHTHTQWVVMIIVLFVAFLLIGIGGTIWHRRYKRRRDYGDSTAPSGSHTAASHPEMSQWAPSQYSVHDFGAGPGPGPSPLRQNTTDSGSPVSESNMRDLDGAGTASSGKGKGKGKEVDRSEGGMNGPGPGSSARANTVSEVDEDAHLKDMHYEGR